ncbi:hypothetical protein ACH3VR_16445 [Microbacterium sp. B2969]|uniref:Uncharacterized protein n=1 Tax=Microbacterium alkaliflavum TaxID=3248839 RepID=A0ABW7QBB9_9MICO
MPDPEKRPGVSPTRIGIWIVVSAVGLYMIVSGLMGVINGGG